MENFKLSINIKILLSILIGVFIYSCGKKAYKTTTGLYNQTKEIQLEYDKVVQQQVSNYDGYYLAFTDKANNANINKETFIEVTNIIMSNRADGASVSWKWLQENQQIPFSEFTVFYQELSSFISERYKDNMAIENKKQELVRDHNRLLQIYPNNIINGFLKIDPLVYKQGYISNYTKDKFK